MNQEDIIYNRAKESLRKYWRIIGNRMNQKVSYECAMILYLVRQEYKEDTRIYCIAQSRYEEERAKINRLQNKISKNEECYEEALEACKDALVYIELVVRPRINIELLV